MVFAPSGPDGAPAPNASVAGDAWFTPLRFGGVLAVLIFAAFPDVVAGSHTFFFGDFGVFGYPLAYYHRECFWRGELPLWNPLNNCGLPFLAQWNTLTLYPLSLFYLLLPLSWSLGVFCLGHLMLAGIGMYFLAHRWTSSRLAAAVAGLAFAFNGLTWFALVWPNNIAALGWMPWVVLTTSRAWSEGGRRVVVAALAGAMQMLAGAPEVILLTWTLLAVLCVGDSLPITAGRRRMAWRRVGRFAVVVLLVTGLAAAQLLPVLDLVAHSQRDSSYSDAGWSMPGTGWANLLVPLFRTFRSAHGIYAQHGQLWTCSYYPGIGVLTLALLAAGRVREKRVRLLAGVACAGLILALGDAGYWYGWLRRVVPQLGFVRFPIKFVVLAVFVFPVLAACAISRVQTLPAADRPREVRTKSFFVLGILSVMGLIVWFAHEYPMPDDDWPATWRNALTRAAFLVLVIGTLAGLHHFPQRNRQWPLQLLLLVLIWLDVLTHAPNLTPTVERNVYEPGLMRTALKLNPIPIHGQSRLLVSPEALKRIHHSTVSLPAYDYLGRRLALYCNCNLLDDFPQVSGFYSLYVREAAEVISRLYASTRTELPRLADFLGVSHATSPDSMFDWIARPTFLPMFTAGQKPVFLEAPESLTAITASDFDPARIVYLSAEARPHIGVTNGTSAQVIPRFVSASRIELEVDAVESALVVIAQTYYRPWRAFVNNRPVRLWRANHAFQALAVPAGRHRIELRYQDQMFFAGAAISMLSMLVCATLWRRPWQRDETWPMR